VVTTYLGPPGTFSHEAARILAPTGSELSDLPDINAVYDSVEGGAADFAVVALENSVEGFVVPSLDRLLHGAVIGIKRLELPIVFQAFRNPGDNGPFTVARSHPHALAQCKNFIGAEHLKTEASNSTAAACVDLPIGYLALAPSVCGDVYGLEALPRTVQDEEVAVTSFLLIARRRHNHLWAETKGAREETLLSITPTSVGSGVLARITATFASRGLNITSLITRPVRNVPGAYTFVLSASVSPEDISFIDVCRELMGAGDSLKVLARYSVALSDSVSESIDEKLRRGSAPAGSCGAHQEDEAVSDALLLSLEDVKILREEK
jgi:prephenate dehydratase